MQDERKQVSVRRWIAAIAGVSPEFSKTELGKVHGPERYMGRSEPGTEECLQNYTFEQWTSRDFIIVVISDRGGRVVRRYARRLMDETGVDRTSESN